MKTKDIIGYEGLYEITEDGRVFRKERTVKTIKKNGQIYTQKLKRIEMKKQVIKCGYLSVNLSKGRNGKPIQIHRLVAKTFIDNPENKSQVNHINGVKTDNRVSNLEWSTPKENTEHAIRNGLRGSCKGTSVWNSKVDENDVKRMRNMYKCGISQIEISKIFNLNKDTVWKIINRKLWSHVK